MNNRRWLVLALLTVTVSLSIVHRYTVVLHCSVKHGLLNSFLRGSSLVSCTEKGFWSFLLYKLQCFHDILPTVHAISAQELAFWQNRHLRLSSSGREFTVWKCLDFTTVLWVSKILAVASIVQLKKEKKEKETTQKSSPKHF